MLCAAYIATRSIDSRETRRGIEHPVGQGLHRDDESVDVANLREQPLLVERRGAVLDEQFATGVAHRSKRRRAARDRAGSHQHLSE
jgi:hypothetical protein